jgi:hypothetical protein
MVAKGKNVTPNCYRVYAAPIKLTLASDSSASTGRPQAVPGVAGLMIGISCYPTFQTRIVSGRGSLNRIRIQPASTRGFSPSM